MKDFDKKEILYLLDNAPVPIIIIDDGGKILYFNKCLYEIGELYGILTPKDLFGKNVFNLFMQSEEKDKARKNLEYILKTDKPLYNFVHKVKTAKGKRCYTLFAASPIVWKDKKAVEISFIILKELKDNEDEKHPLEKLSTREQQIIFFIVEGFKPINIAAQLHITEATVRTHMKSIYKKLNIHSKDELIRLLTGNSTPSFILLNP